MRSFPIAAALIGAAAVAGTAAFAADAPGRYTLTPKGDGYVRLDTQTGQVSECTGPALKLVCSSTADERAAMQAEIDRLQAKVDLLETEKDALEIRQKPSEFELPDEKQLDKAFSFFERMIKRFRGLMQDLQKEPSETTPL